MATPNEMKFAEAWRALDEETTRPGWNTLPIATNSGSLLLAGRQHPSNQESMLIGFTVAGLPKQASLPQGKGFSLENVELPFQGTRYYCLAITRHPSASLDIFSAMLDDIVAVLERSNRSEADHIAAIVDRILGWQRFMSREDDGVLRAEYEVGLLGELHVLRLLIGAGIPIADVVEWWTGPFDSLHDFVCPRGERRGKKFRAAWRVLSQCRVVGSARRKHNTAPLSCCGSVQLVGERTSLAAAHRFDLRPSEG